MKRATIPLLSASIGRCVYLHCPGGPPTEDALGKAGSAWLSSHMEPIDAERAVASTRVRPLEIGVQEVADLPPLPEMEVARAGVEEVAAYWRATHVVSVFGASDATGHGWLGVESYARGVAKEFDGVVADLATGRLHPLDDRTSFLRRLEAGDVCHSFSIPLSADRWCFTTVGMVNLGLPEVFFGDVGESEVEEAVRVIQAIRDGLANQAATCLRSGGDTLASGWLTVPHLPRVGLTPAGHPLLNEPALRAFVRGRHRKSMGHMLRHARRDQDVATSR